MSERIAQLDVRRLAPKLVVGILVGFALLYIVVLANPSPDIGGNWRTTTFGSAIDDWQSFTRTLLNGLTFAGLLFIVASGFSLIFGLMRVVNMAHGSFYLLGGYIAYEVQQKMTGSGYSIAGVEVNTWEWVFPALIAAASIGLVGLVVQQVFLRHARARRGLRHRPVSSDAGVHRRAEAHAAYILARTEGVVGFFGASSMERLPTEVAMTENMKRFKSIPVKGA